MKTLKGLAAGLFAVLITILFTACPNPQGQISITIDPAGNLTVAPGQTVTWNVTLTPDSTQSSALGQFFVIANQDTVFNTDLQGVTESRSFQVNYTVPQDAQNGQNINITFVAVDAKSGLSSSVAVVLTVNAETYQEHQDITLTWNSTTLDNHMMLVLTSDGVSLDGGGSTVGIIAYMYNGSDNIRNTIASPNAQEIADAYSANGINYSTSDKHETYFKRVTGQVNWDDIDQATIDNLALTANESDVIAGNPDLGYGVSTLAANDIIAFDNPATNVKGYILVKSFSTAKGAKISTTLTIDIKYVAGPAQTAK